MNQFVKCMLSSSRPASVQQIALPRRQQYFPSPVDWRNEILYFLLVDRFSDGLEATRPLLNRDNLVSARPARKGQPWRWDRWAESGALRWQGGTLCGVQSKLSYLKNLGITTIWVSPVFKQRVHTDTYHGYAIQDFLDIDPRFGTRQDLVELVQMAHNQGMRVILDVIFNHSGANWCYADGEELVPYYPYPGCYPFGQWLDSTGEPTAGMLASPDDGVWPCELQDVDVYARAGCGDFDGGDAREALAEHKLMDFFDLRAFNLARSDVLETLITCYKYWIALTDCDGFRIDTLRHVSIKQARTFCQGIKEYAMNLGKENFFLVGEVAGGDDVQAHYLQELAPHLDAVLDIASMRISLHELAKGLTSPKQHFQGYAPDTSAMATLRSRGNHHLSVLDDHDHIYGPKVRFSTDAASEHQVVAGVALQLFTLGIPCLYYGTEQAFAGPEPAAREWLSGWGGAGEYVDRYLREAMFGPEHPRKSGVAGIPSFPDMASGPLDKQLPGFGPFGTVGHHCFDLQHPAYLRIAALAKLRQQYPALRFGRQLIRDIAVQGQPFGPSAKGEIVAWSRLLDDEEVLCLLNVHGHEVQSAAILVDSQSTPVGTCMVVIGNTMQAVDGNTDGTNHPCGTCLPVQKSVDGKAFVEVHDLGPSEMLLVINRAVT